MTNSIATKRYPRLILGLYLLFVTPLKLGVCNHHVPVNLQVTLLHTNDLHSYFSADGNYLQLGGIQKLKTQIDQIKKNLNSPQNNHMVLQLDAGDFSEGSLGFIARQGDYTYQAMQALKYDAIALGNHDWFYGIPFVLQKLGQFPLPLLSANLRDPSASNELPVLPPYSIFTQQIGSQKISVAVVGLSTNEIFYQPFVKPYYLSDPIMALKKLMPELQKQASIVIVLSHLGLDKDKVLAQKVNGINVIIGGHSHTRLNQPEWSNGTPIVQAGCHGQFLGQTTLSYDSVKQTSELMDYQLHPIKPSLTDDRTLNALVQEAHNVAKETTQHFNYQNFTLDLKTPLLTPENGLSNLSNLLVDALKKELKVDFAFIDKRTLGHAFEASRIYSFSDFYNLNPFIFNFATQQTWTIKTFKLKGQDLKYLLHYMVLLSPEMSVSGMKLVLNNFLGQPLIDHIDLPPSTPGRPLEGISAHTLDPEQVYTFASNDLVFQFLEGLKALKRPIPAISYVETHKNINDYLVSYLSGPNGTTASAKELNQKLQLANNLHARYQDVEFDYYVPPFEIKALPNALQIPIYNMGLYEVAVGFDVQVWMAPQANEITAKSKHYQLIGQKSYRSDWRDEAIPVRYLEIPWNEISDNRVAQGLTALTPGDSYHLLVLVRPKNKIKEGNFLNNFQEAWVKIPKY